MGVTMRNGLLHCLFWTKTMFALMLSLTGLFYLCWRVYDLHSFAVGATSGFSEAPNVLAPVVIVDPGTGTVAQSCAFDETKGFARLEPQTNGRLMLGLSLDWSYDTPRKIQAKMNGVTPAVFSAWLQLNPSFNNGDGYDKNTLNWFGSECGRTGSILEITFETSGVLLDTLPQSIYDSVAADLTAINTKYGVPVLFRWNHEMNGDWTIYGYQPTAYIASFKKMATAVRARTNMTAMVWGPNVGLTYPFIGGGQAVLPLPGTPDFALLDTNGDNVIDNKDDPYTPYFPGDDAVDWVGVSLYNYPLPDCHNCAIIPTYFNDYLTAQGPAAESVAAVTAKYTAVHNFYEMFCTPTTHNKPLLLPETGAPYVNEQAGYTDSIDEATRKASWWAQLTSKDTLTNFPKFKMASNFEEAKVITYNEQQNQHVSWQLTNSTAVLGAWNSLVAQNQGNMLMATQLKYGCDGSVTLK